jgi:DNA-binding transcriptional MerR regulator
MSYTISQLAKRHHLSRSTLLYYERIGLLHAQRAANGYRCYGQTDDQRLERICRYRDAGLALEEIQTLIDEPHAPAQDLLEKRLRQINDDIVRLRQQQHEITRLLSAMAHQPSITVITKDQWVDMLATAGMDEAAMQRWHAAFEQRSPQAHDDFLRSLGLDEQEVTHIRHQSQRAWQTR